MARSLRPSSRLAVLLLLAACGTSAALARPAAPQGKPGAQGAQGDSHKAPGMLRYPDVSATQVVFAYADGLWVVPRTGGMASPLSSPPGPEVFPRFSPDGQSILFSGNYDGGRDLFTMPVAGGVPTRLTHHPLPESVCDWTADNRILFSSAHESLLAGRAVQLFTLPPTGGLPEKLPVPYGGDGAISEDGEWLAYVPIPFDQRTWKRYEGGTAMDIWLFNLKTHTSRRMTDWEGTDTYPMWRGNTVYYLSDAGSNHHLNIWAYDIGTEKRRQVTDLGDFDVRWPRAGRRRRDRVPARQRPAAARPEDRADAQARGHDPRRPPLHRAAAARRCGRGAELGGLARRQARGGRGARRHLDAAGRARQPAQPDRDRERHRTLSGVEP
jgi:tricorn protease